MSARPTCAVVGAGVVGAAIASYLARQHCAVYVFDRNSRAGRGATSRNSGVIHAGLYYPPDSLKAKLCLRGRMLLYDWCKSHNVAHRKIGKLVVASSDHEKPALENLWKNAQASGAVEAQLINRNEISKFEPHVQGSMALWSPESGIIDSHELTDSLVADGEANHAEFIFSADVRAIEKKNGKYRLQTTRGELDVDCVINAAGLYADEIARFSGREITIDPWRGDYFKLTSPFPFQRLIYPVQAPESPNLGIHLTIDLSGRYRLGPDAEHSNSKEDFSPREEKKSAFVEAGRKLFPWLEPSMLSYDMCGIRAKVKRGDPKSFSDFIVSEDLPRWINLIGIESPGLTASLALAEHVAEFLEI